MADKMKVLIAEDEEDIRRGLQIQLEARGYDVISASDGEEAVRLTQTGDPDIVILDLLMPKKDGFEVMRELRRLPKWRPVIIVSALSELEHVRKGYDLEADYYLPKPCKVDTLVEGIKIMQTLIPLRKQGPA